MALVSSRDGTSMPGWYRRRNEILVSRVTYAVKRPFVCRHTVDSRNRLASCIGKNLDRRGARRHEWICISRNTYPRCSRARGYATAQAAMHGPPIGRDAPATARPTRTLRRRGASSFFYSTAQTCTVVGREMWRWLGLWQGGPQGIVYMES